MKFVVYRDEREKDASKQDYKFSCVKVLYIVEVKSVVNSSFLTHFPKLAIVSDGIF